MKALFQFVPPPIYFWADSDDEAQDIMREVIRTMYVPLGNREKFPKVFSKRYEIEALREKMKAAGLDIDAFCEQPSSNYEDIYIGPDAETRKPGGRGMVQ